MTTPAPTSVVTPPPAAPVWAQSVRIPAAHRFVVLEGFGQVRAWIVDETGATAPVAAVEWSPVGSPGADQFAVTPDGRSILVSSVIPGGRAAIHLVRPETGDVSVIAADADADLLYPRIAADGTFAYVRIPLVQPGPRPRDGGVYVARLVVPHPPPPATGTSIRISIAPDADGRRLPLAFSDDASLLALRRESVGWDIEVLVVRTGEVRPAASGSFAEWRPRTHEVLVGGRSSDFLYRIVVHDVDRATSRLLEAPRGEFNHGLRWDASGDRFLFQQARSALVGSESDLVIHDLARGTRDAIATPLFSFGFAWSRDSRLLGVQAGDDSVISVFDLATRRVVGSMCLRSRRAPCV